MYSSTPSLGVCGQHCASTTLLPGKTRYPLYRRLGGPQGLSGQLWKISPPPGFDPRTVQPIASLYTDYAIPAHRKMIVQTQNFGHQFIFFFRIASVTFLRACVLFLTHALKLHFFYGI